MISFNAEQRFIVTGASSGIGEGVALLLNELGATVVGIGRNAERLASLKGKCKCPERMHLEQKDLVEDIPGLPAYVKVLREKYGKFSGMAYCAGVACLQPLRLCDYELSRTVFDVNYHAPMFFTKGMIDRRNVTCPGASLVYLSSIDALISTKGQPLYSGSKAALAASVKTTSKEVASFGIRMNCLLPSMIKTPMTVGCETADKLDVTEDSQRDAYPFGWGEVSDLASFIVYLLSPKSKFISGQRYVYDSGLNQ